MEYLIQDGLKEFGWAAVIAVMVIKWLVSTIYEYKVRSEGKIATLEKVVASQDVILKEVQHNCKARKEESELVLKKLEAIETSLNSNNK